MCLIVTLLSTCYSLLLEEEYVSNWILCFTYWIPSDIFMSIFLYAEACTKQKDVK